MKRFLLLSIITALLLGGCATVPSSLANDPYSMSRMGRVSGQIAGELSGGGSAKVSKYGYYGRQVGHIVGDYNKKRNYRNVPAGGGWEKVIVTEHYQNGQVVTKEKNMYVPNRYK